MQTQTIGSGTSCQRDGPAAEWITRHLPYVCLRLAFALGGDFRSAPFVEAGSGDSSASPASASDSVVSPSANRSSICPSVQVNSRGLETEGAGVACAFFSGIDFRASSFIMPLIRIPVVRPAGEVPPTVPVAQHQVRCTSLTRSVPSTRLISHFTSSGIDTTFSSAQCPFASDANSSTTRTRC